MIEGHHPPENVAPFENFGQFLEYLLKRMSNADPSHLLVNPSKDQIRRLVGEIRADPVVGINDGLRGLKTFNHRTRREWTFLWPAHMWLHHEIAFALEKSGNVSTCDNRLFNFDDEKNQRFSEASLEIISKWVKDPF